MGTINLDNMRAELKNILDRPENNTNLDRWINFGYYDLCSSVDFEIMDEVFAIAMSVGVRTYPFTPIIGSAPVFMGIKACLNVTRNSFLEYIPKVEFYTYEPYSERPRIFTLDRTNLLVHPTPTLADTLNVIYKKPPAKLVAGTDITVIPGPWDLPVVQLAASHAFRVVDEHEKAERWKLDAISYISTRIGEEAHEFQQMGKYPAFVIANKEAIE